MTYNKKRYKDFKRNLKFMKINKWNKKMKLSNKEIN